eukprot:12697905-Heterocapsa_arctica.AAC.1
MSQHRPTDHSKTYSVGPTGPTVQNGPREHCSVDPTGVHIQVVERSSGVLAITIKLLAERLYFCTTSELEIPSGASETMLFDAHCSC